MRKPKRSLRSILTLWFLLFSLLPLFIITFYSVMSYRSAIDNELSLRLTGNAREIEIQLNDILSNLNLKRQRFSADPSLIFNLSMQNSEALKSHLTEILRNDNSTTFNIYGRDARLIISVFKDSNGGIQDFRPNTDVIFLSEKVVSTLKQNRDFNRVEVTDQKKITLRSFSKVLNSKNKLIGYFEQSLDLDSAYLTKLKSQMKLEIQFIQDANFSNLSTTDEWSKSTREKFKVFLQDSSKSVFNLDLKSNSYGVFFYPLKLGGDYNYLALGATKTESQLALKKVNYAFFTVVIIVSLITFLSIVLASRRVLKPLDDLISALLSFESQEQAVTIPVRSSTEIGQLTESFNQMSLKIAQTRTELNKKIKELEKTNQELKDAQVQLVQSAKMMSLGQLVAGVAHELNNPISFIYSNMTYLKDYANRLFELVDTVEKNPSLIAQKKVDIEYEYIQKDLPKLISSCEDGARRTRDIVLNLRNFSRLDQAHLQEVNLEESLNSTLELLSGEIKNRVEVHKNFQAIPLVHCFASQINQVFMNILGNALQAIEGVGHIWISTAVIASGSKVSISIQDSGKGIPAEHLQKIFDPFFTTKGVGQGTGLGLSISYGIIHSHGGEIEVKSEPNVGTEFIISLPVNFSGKV